MNAVLEALSAIRQPAKRRRGRSPRFHIQFAMEGRYMLEAIKESGEVTQRTGWIDNVITNTGKNFFLSSGASVAFHPVIGTGTATPLVTDTVLTSFLAGVSNSSGGQTYSQTVNLSSAPYFIRLTFKNRFGLGVAAGNITELGMHCSNAIGTTPNSASPLFSHALVKDAGGTPTAVTVLSNEYLDVTWELTIYIATSVTGTVPQSIKGVNTTPAYVMTPAVTSVVPPGANDGGWGMTSASGTGATYVTFPVPFTTTNTGITRTRLFPGTTAQPAITAAVSNGTNAGTNNASSSTAASYTAGSFFRDYTYTWGLNYGNAATIRCFKFDITMANFWLYYTDGSSFTKVNTDVLTVTISLSVS